MLIVKFHKFIEQLWYARPQGYWLLLHWLLRPIAIVYYAAHWIRKIILNNVFKHEVTIPIIVVGNITVGGVGKTPLVIDLAAKLCGQGLRVGIISRGYKATIKTFPFEVNVDCDAAEVGDESLILAKNTNCPIVIDPKRNRAVEYLIKKYQPQIVISDDGLQHYSMGRAIEIVIIDGNRKFGNGWCLPAGPLRELPGRLWHSDFVIINGKQEDACNIQAYAMHFKTQNVLINILSGETYSTQTLQEPIAAVAAIGNPHQFFEHLKKFSLIVHEYAFPDHHIFKSSELQFNEPTVIMTEKDAVKCRSFARTNWFYLPITAQVDDKFWHALYIHKKLKGLIKL
ncbi:MAG: tetraacyldisaccharide 4'-kinase [Legionellales bacterium RIFCSPHIGHO2_12_FULL_35_11]|nr:MAG: tetraacyldisaccharide 4'-kinase [Legionellales bacterium RIFCSPHIGHO2_12_FULL_35_11]